MASSAHQPGSDLMPERSESDEEFARKASILADWLREARHAIFFTGAGISTSAGISDFRGPSGAWTLKAQGRLRPAASRRLTSPLKAVPTLAHMSLVTLQDEGILKYLISQNCDGLHLRSGIQRSNISELHGNLNLERCPNPECGKEYLRDFRTHVSVTDHGHTTGRHCLVCGTGLLDSAINFDEMLPEVPLNLAWENSKKADLCVVLGSSCTVVPAADMPKLVANRGKRVVVVNLQRTPLHGEGGEGKLLEIHSGIDRTMEFVMERLGLPIKKWILRRRLNFKWAFLPEEEEEDQKYVLRLGGVEIEDGRTPYEILKGVRVFLKQRVEGLDEPALVRIAESNRKPSQSVRLPHTFPGKDLWFEESIFFCLSFFRKYDEPDLMIRVNGPGPDWVPEGRGRKRRRKRGQQAAEEDECVKLIDLHASFDPEEGVWRMEDCEGITMVDAMGNDV